MSAVPDSHKPVPDSSILQATYLGVTGLLLESNDAQILVDGFFTRPGKLHVLFGKVYPDSQLIAAGIQRAKIQNLRAILVSHSHYDHALDAPEIARQCGATLYGSLSTQILAQGNGLPRSQAVRINPGYLYGEKPFEFRFYASRHSFPNLYPGEITEPFHSPAPVSFYREGGSYTIWITSQASRLLVQSSAGFVPGALRDVRADHVFLSVASLARRGKNWIETYFSEVVLAVQARHVYPIHWDDFQQPARDPLPHLPRFLDPVDGTMDLIHFLCDRHAIEYTVPPFLKPFHLFM